MELYKCDYVGGLDIENLHPEGYKVKFYLNRSENPLVIIADLPDKEFLSFLKNELRTRKLQKVLHCIIANVDNK